MLLISLIKIVKKLLDGYRFLSTDYAGVKVSPGNVQFEQRLAKLFDGT